MARVLVLTVVLTLAGWATASAAAPGTTDDWFSILQNTPQTAEFVRGSSPHANLNKIAFGHAEGMDLAAIPIVSGGSAGVLEVVVFRVYADFPDHVTYLGAISLSTSLVRMAFSNDRLHIVTEDLAPGDADCCPSALYDTPYHWTGLAFLAQKSTLTLRHR